MQTVHHAEAIYHSLIEGYDIFATCGAMVSQSWLVPWAGWHNVTCQGCLRRCAEARQCYSCGDFVLLHKLHAPKCSERSRFRWRWGE